MGNACTCINEESRDKEEFKNITSDRKDKEKHVIVIQKHFRAFQARKEYSQMKYSTINGR